MLQYDLPEPPTADNLISSDYLAAATQEPEAPLSTILLIDMSCKATLPP